MEVDPGGRSDMTEAEQSTEPSLVTLIVLSKKLGFHMLRQDRSRGCSSSEPVMCPPLIECTGLRTPTETRLYLRKPDTRVIAPVSRSLVLMGRRMTPWGQLFWRHSGLNDRQKP